MPRQSPNNPGTKTGTTTRTKERNETLESSEELPEIPMKNVYLLNDDITPFEFVIQCLQGIFNQSRESAAHITFFIHENGEALIARYTEAVAEEKVKSLREAAQEAGYPLRAETR